MISKEKQFIFIHNFKAGGTSTEIKLGHFDLLERDVQDNRTIREIKLLTKRSLHYRTSLYALKKGQCLHSIILKRQFTHILPLLNTSRSSNFHLFGIPGHGCIPDMPKS